MGKNYNPFTASQKFNKEGESYPIRSFVNRRTRITRGQVNALKRLTDQWCIPYVSHPISLATIFKRCAPTVLEIGFGTGEVLATLALENPEKNFLGIEVFNAGVGSLLGRIEKTGVDNLRIVQHDAVEVLRNMILPRTLAGVHAYFPDPWQKKRHHKRRLIQNQFSMLLARCIAAGGYFHCATDWQPYADQIYEVLSHNPMFFHSAHHYALEPCFRLKTKFETRGLKLGHHISEFVFERI